MLTNITKHENVTVMSHRIMTLTFHLKQPFGKTGYKSRNFTHKLNKFVKQSFSLDVLDCYILLSYDSFTEIIVVLSCKKIVYVNSYRPFRRREMWGFLGFLVFLRKQ